MSVKLKYLCLAHRWPYLPVNGCRKEEINTSPPESDQKQEMFDFTLFPFNIKEAWILIQGRWFFGTLVHHLLGLLAFWIKSLPQQLISQFIGLLCCEQYKLGLGNIWISIRQMRKLRIREVKLVAQRHTAKIWTQVHLTCQSAQNQPYYHQLKVQVPGILYYF